SPDAGSTRPGATACQRFSSGVSVRAAFAASSAPILGTSAVNAQAPPMAPRAIRTIILFFRGVTLDHTVVLALSNGLSALALLADDAPVLDAHHSPRERQYTRIVGHHQDGARGVFGDPGQQPHDGMAIFAVQGGGRLIREDCRCIS